MVSLNLENLHNEENELAILNWCKSCVAMLKDGGIWGIPRSKVAFRVNKKENKLVLVAGNCEKEFGAVKYWFGKIGWKVEKYKDFEVKKDAS